MVQLELPHVNVLTKVDLLAEENKARPNHPVWEYTLSISITHSITHNIRSCRDASFGRAIQSLLQAHHTARVEYNLT